jgi:hypothetical protein
MLRMLDFRLWILLMLIHNHSAFLGFPRKSFFFTFDEIDIPTKCYPNIVEISMFRNFDFDFGFDLNYLLATKSKFQTDFVEFRCRNRKFYFDSLSEFRPIISSKVEINFDWNSDRNTDEINFGGNPTNSHF